jgi:predicted DsbA family dithiol-disulfide isomerase
VAWLRRQVGAEVEWLPYHLHPEYPPEGIDRAELVARYGDHFSDGVRAMALEAGLPFNPHPERIPNTRAALELSEWARSQGGDAHERLHERLMDAVWMEGRDITSWDELVACADDVGLDAATGREAVQRGDLAPAVDAWTHWAQSRGIAAIPAFVFEERLLVSGAVPQEALARAAERVREIMAAEG